jgi:3-oxoacyl-[acyl-carrier protein] reductase
LIALNPPASLREALRAWRSKVAKNSTAIKESASLFGLALTRLLELTAFFLRMIKYWSGFADDFASPGSKCGATAVAAGGNVSRAAEAEGIIDAAIKTYGRLDILVNNSGVYEFAPIEAVTEEQFHRMFNINVLGALLTTPAAVKHLGEGSSIINIGSLAGRITLPNSVVYSGTKGALDAITGALARELGPRKIRGNSINPGIVKTEGTHKGGFIGSNLEKAVVAQTPLGRTGQVNDIAPITVFLASDDSQWLTGEQLLASGGFR